MNVVETLQAEQAELTAKLSELDERVKTERPGLVGQLAQLNRAINALTKPVGTPGTRKPMSEEGKAAIKAGLEKARAAKLATNGKSEASTTAMPAATLQEPNAGGKKSPASDKGPSRVG